MNSFQSMFIIGSTSVVNRFLGRGIANQRYRDFNTSLYYESKLGTANYILLNNLSQLFKFFSCSSVLFLGSLSNARTHLPSPRSPWAVCHLLLPAPLGGRLPNARSDGWLWSNCGVQYGHRWVAGTQMGELKRHRREDCTRRLQCFL